MNVRYNIFRWTQYYQSLIVHYFQQKNIVPKHYSYNIGKPKRVLVYCCILFERLRSFKSCQPMQKESCFWCFLSFSFCNLYSISYSRFVPYCLCIGNMFSQFRHECSDLNRPQTHLAQHKFCVTFFMFTLYYINYNLLCVYFFFF